MLRIKQNKLIWFVIILLGVILIGIPAAVYADDVLLSPDPIVDEGNLDQDNYDADSYNADSDVPDFTLGSSTGDFVFTPVSPCRIIDTRNAGGKIPAGGTRSFFVHGSALTGQGGNAAGCISPVGEPRGVLLNIVAVNSSAPGYLTVWPYNTTRPLAGVLNYSPYDITDPISNAFAVKTSYNITYDISVYAYAQTHVVADVLGYFSMPEATAVQTTVQNATGTVSNGGGLSLTASCPTGYQVTGGGCHFNLYNTPNLIINGSRPFGNGWNCLFTNRYGSTQGVNVHAVCTRVPGR